MAGVGDYRGSGKSLANAAGLHGCSACAAQTATADFEARLGDAWIAKDSWSGPYPLFAWLRPGPGELSPTISVEKYPEGNPMFPNAKRFVSSLQRVSLPAPERASAVGRAAVQGEDQTLWRRRVKRGEHPLGDAGAEYEENLVVLEAGADFYVLRLRAPAAQAADRRRDFERFLSSFKLRRRRR